MHVWLLKYWKSLFQDISVYFRRIVLFLMRLLVNSIWLWKEPKGHIFLGWRMILWPVEQSWSLCTFRSILAVTFYSMTGKEVKFWSKSLNHCYGDQFLIQILEFEVLGIKVFDLNHASIDSDHQRGYTSFLTRVLVAWVIWDESILPLKWFLTGYGPW